MANSVVKVTDATNDAISDSLLLLVGEDGTVTPDRQTVDKYLIILYFRFKIRTNKSPDYAH